MLPSGAHQGAEDPQLQQKFMTAVCPISVGGEVHGSSSLTSKFLVDSHIFLVRLLRVCTRWAHPLPPKIAQLTHTPSAAYALPSVFSFLPLLGLWRSYARLARRGKTRADVICVFGTDCWRWRRQLVRGGCYNTRWWT